jgi:hypothetical protein
MVHGGLVRAADIHAGPTTNRLKPFKNLDGIGVIAIGFTCGITAKKVGHYLSKLYAKVKQVACLSRQGAIFNEVVPIRKGSLLKGRQTWLKAKGADLSGFDIKYFRTGVLV